MLRNTCRTGGDLRGVSAQTTHPAGLRRYEKYEGFERGRPGQRRCCGNATRQPQALRGVIRHRLPRSRADPCHNRPNAPSLRLIPEGEYPDTLTGRRVFRLGLRGRGRYVD